MKQLMFYCGEVGALKDRGRGVKQLKNHKSYWIINQVVYTYVYDMDITYADCMCCVYTPCTAHFGVHTYVCLRLLYYSIKGVENWKWTIIGEEIILMRSLNVVKSR